MPCKSAVPFQSERAMEEWASTVEKPAGDRTGTRGWENPDRVAETHRGGSTVNLTAVVEKVRFNS